MAAQCPNHLIMLNIGGEVITNEEDVGLDELDDLQGFLMSIMGMKRLRCVKYWVEIIT